MVKLKSTTWEGRNEDSLIELKIVAGEIGYHSPRITDVGIGGITHSLANLFPTGPKKEMNFAQKVQRFLPRLVDNFARKHNLYSRLKTYELEEVQDFFSSLNPKEILVVDNDQRVLDSIQGNGTLKKLILDICEFKLPYPTDILICYNVLQISSSPLNGLKNLLDSVAVGGLLSLETGKLPLVVEDSRYEKLSKHLYRRHW